MSAAADIIARLEPALQSLDRLAIGLGSRSISLLDIVTAIALVVALYIATRFALRWSGRLIERSSRLDGSQRVLLQKFAGIGIVGVALLIGIDVLGIDLTALAVFSGALGLAIGFGLQKTFGNLLAGIILLMDKSIKPGDVIVIGDTFGWVNRIGIRAVSVLTRDAKEFLIPNEKLMTEQVENWSFSSRNVRIHIPVGVAYSADQKLAQSLMLQAARETPRVLSDPEPSVWMTAFGDNAVEYDILCWIVDAEQGIGNVRSAVLNRLWDLFKDNGVEIPFPQHDIHVKSWPATGSSAASSHPGGSTRPEAVTGTTGQAARAPDSRER